ncbi:MAG: MerC domain-containing protein [Gammaproteobacteria bacterium]
MFAKHTPHWDNTGIYASGLCVAHCLMLPVMAAFLPWFGLEFLAQDITHQAMVLLLIGFGLCAFIPGYRLHGKFWVATFALMGWVIAAFAAFAAGEIFGEYWETLLTILGSAILITAHLKNLSFCRLCALCTGQMAYTQSCPGQETPKN